MMLSLNGCQKPTDQKNDVDLDGIETEERASVDSEVNAQSSTPSPTPAAKKSPKPITPTPSPSPSASARSRCVTPDTANFAISNSQQLFDFINLLPRPLSIPCFLDALPHPLNLNATTSRISAQPAGDDENPRFFIFAGPESKLVISAVPSGEGSSVIEYSIMISDIESIKGEIAFPILDTVVLNTVNSRIAAKSPATGTTCGGCHTGERLAPIEFYGANQFISRALSPKSTSQVSEGRLKELNSQCKNIQSERCNIYDAIFGATGINIQLFPALTPNFF